MTHELDIGDWTRRSRAASGLPEHVTDTATAEQVAAILRAQIPDATRPRTESRGRISTLNRPTLTTTREQDDADSTAPAP